MLEVEDYRKDTIIMSLTQLLRELEASPEPQDRSHDDLGEYG